MTRDETLNHWQRFEQIRETAFNNALESGASVNEARGAAHDAITNAWNSWADELLAHRDKLEKSGEWQAVLLENFEDDKSKCLKGKNEATRLWLELADLDFRDITFVAKDRCNKSEQIKSSANYPFGETLDRITIFMNTNSIELKSFKFPSNVRFNRSVFDCSVNCAHTEWNGPAHFFGCEFKADVIFKNSIFKNFCRLAACKFSSYCNFMDTKLEDVFFNLSVFKFTVRFDRVSFGGFTNFLYCEFEYYTSFFECQFKKEAYFSAVNAKRHFDFGKVVFLTKAPNFSQATFAEAPRLDVIYFDQAVEPGGFWRSLVRSSDFAETVIGKYRDLRRLAIQGHDHNSEARFLKGEIRARRNAKDKIWQSGWWIGVFYDGISDCGQSISRPLVVWLLSIFAFSALYLSQSNFVFFHRSACASMSSDPRMQALLLSVKNAFVAFSTTRDPRIVDAYNCVFAGGAIPLPVTLIEMLVQVPLSATLIFLFVLAVRNKFKIR